MTRLVFAISFVSLVACITPPAGQPNAPAPLEEQPTADEVMEAPLHDDIDLEAEMAGMEVAAQERMNEPATPTTREPHPLAHLTDEQLEALVLEDPAALGPVSLGRPGGGALLNAVPMPEGTMWHIVNPSQTWATQETIDSLVRCIEAVNRAHPDTLPVRVGDISEKNGGRIAPHSSHQSGRDVDVGYYYTTGNKWYVRANGKNLDLARTWTFVRAMITETDVQAIFIDRRIQRQLEDYALAIGEDPAWLDDIFRGRGRKRRALITHQPGHDTHIHVRFYNPIAQETGRRVYPILLAHRKISPPTSYVHYRARKGDNLGRIARRYKTTVKALKRANGLRSNRIYAGRTYRIPRRGGVPRVSKLVVPPRRLPPTEGGARLDAADVAGTDPDAGMDADDGPETGMDEEMELGADADGSMEVEEEEDTDVGAEDEP